MAVIGFLIVAGVGCLLIVAGLALTYGSTQIGDRSTLAPLLISVVGGAMLYWACHSAPFTLTVTT